MGDYLSSVLALGILAKGILLGLWEGAEGAVVGWGGAVLSRMGTELHFLC